MDRPIGWWLKHLDRLIDDSFEAAYVAVGLERREWQVLNVLAEQPQTSPAELTAALAPFWGDDGDAPGVLAALAGRGLVDCGRGGRWTLTAAGEASRSAASDAVAGIRARMAAGVTREEYQGTVDVLARMATNLSTPTG